MPKFIPDLAHAWKYRSVNLPVLCIAIQAVIVSDEADFHDLPSWARCLVHVVNILLLVCSQYDRLIDHSPGPTEPPGPLPPGA
jgi:hypothetical protein